MRERLKMLIAEANVEWLNKTYDHETDKTLAEYTTDNLLANGVIVPLRKLGEVVYSYLHSWKKEDGIAPYQIINITITQNEKGEWTERYRAMQVEDGNTIDWQLNFAFDEIGKTVFLTREEAEKVLAERRE